MQRRHLAALAFAAATATAGCGGSSTTLTSSQLKAKAEPICARTNAKLNAATSATRPQDVARAASDFAAYVKQSSAELSALNPPSSMAEDWKAIVLGYQSAGKAIAKLGEDVARKGAPDVAAVKEFTNAQHQRTVIALHDGLKECAR